MTLINKQRLLKASGFNGLGFIVSSVVSIAWWLLVTRLYPADQSGRLILAISVAGVINLLDLGLTMGLTSLVSTQQGIKRSYFPAQALLGVSLKFTLLLEAVVGGAGLAWWIFEHPSDPFLDAWTAFLVLGFALSTQVIQLCIGLFKGCLRFREANIASTGSTTLVFGIGAVQAWMDLGIVHVLASMTFMQVTAAILALRYAMKNITSGLNSNDYSEQLKILRLLVPNALPFYPQLFTGIFFNHVQRFLIAHFVGLDHVAILSLAFSISTRLHAVCNAFLEVLFPMARHIKDAGQRPLEFCIRTGAIAALIYGIVGGLLVLLAHEFMPSLALPLGVFGIGVACSVAAAPAFHILNGTGESWQVSLASILSTVTYMAAVMILHSVGATDEKLLLPISYCAASLIIVLQTMMVLNGVQNRVRLPV